MLATVAQALPQRSSRRFFPRGEDEIPEVAVQGETLEPKFRLQTPSFTSPVKPINEPAAADLQVKGQVEVSTSRSFSVPAASRSRGTTTFLQSLRKENPIVDPAKLEQLGRAATNIQTKKPSSRPSSNRATGRPLFVVPPAVNENESPIKPDSLPPNRLSALKPSSRTADKITAPGTVDRNPASGTADRNTAHLISTGDQTKSDVDEKSPRQQRLLQIKKRPRPGQPTKETETQMQTIKEIIAESSISDIETKTNDFADDTNIQRVAAKLDEQEVISLDETIHDKESKRKAKPMADVIDSAIDNIEQITLALSTTSVPEPEEPSTTTLLPTTTRRVATLSQLRSSRQRPSASGPIRASTPVAKDDEQAVVAVEPRLNTRRGGRGNSRGGAALATPPRASRPSLGGPSSRVSSRLRTPVAEDQAQIDNTEETSQGGRLAAPRRRVSN